MKNEPMSPSATAIQVKLRATAATMAMATLLATKLLSEM